MNDQRDSRTDGRAEADPALQGEGQAALLDEQGGEAATGKYVYCIIPCIQDHDFGPIGIGENAGRVHTLRDSERPERLEEVDVRSQDRAAGRSSESRGS